jgi:hypothetical protein
MEISQLSTNSYQATTGTPASLLTRDFNTVYVKRLSYIPVKTQFCILLEIIEKSTKDLPNQSLPNIH